MLCIFCFGGKYCKNAAKGFQRTKSYNKTDLKKKKKPKKLVSISDTLYIFIILGYCNMFYSISLTSFIYFGLLEG